MMMMMLSQDEIDSLLSNLSVATTSNPQPQAAQNAKPSITAGGSQSGIERPKNTLSIADILSEEKQKNYKIYNFKRPDKFSKDTLRALETLHETFSRNVSLLLAAYLRTSVTVDVVSVDQLTYDEFVRSMPRPITVGIIEMSGLKHQQLFGMSHELTMSVLDRILGGTGISNAKPRELTDIEGNIMRKMYKRMLDILSESWKPILPGCVTYLKGLEESYTALQITSPGEIVAVVTFEMTISTKESGLLSLCLPFPAVEKIMGHLSTQHLFSGQMAEDEEQPLHTDTILNNMNYAHMPISVLLGGCQLNMQQVMRLRAGDVLMLDRLSGSDMLVCINKKPKFFATPGGVHGHLAVCIKDPVNEAEAVTGFGLSDQNETFC